MALKNFFDFSGKSVVLTGATGGLGRPITLGFAEAGARIALCDINQDSLAKVGAEVKSRGAEIITATVDLCVPEEMQQFVATVQEKYGRIDVLVNLVGGIIRKPSINYPLQEWEHVMDINLKACWVACQAVGKVMIEQKQGRIVNFSSNAGIHGIAGYPAYGPAKAGVIALTRVLAVEWGPFGICTNALAPGFTNTPLNEEVLTDPKKVEKILARMPLGQVLPDDALVGPTLFLASDAARWMASKSSA